MKSKRTKVVPPKDSKPSKIAALKPYSISDFIEEMKSPMPFIDIVSRVHLLTGYNKSALIILGRYCTQITGYHLWKKRDEKETPSNLQEVKIGGKTFLLNSWEPPKTHHEFLFEFLDALIIGRDVDNYFIGIDPDDYDKHVFGESKLTLNQIALICHYNSRTVPKKGAAKIAKEYGHTGSPKLYDHYRNLKTASERIRWANELKRNLKQFEAIRPHLNDSGKAMWNDELETVNKSKR